MTQTLQQFLVTLGARRQLKDVVRQLDCLAGGRLVAGPEDIPVGHLVVAEDPFGNLLVLLDLSKGRYVVDETGRVTGVAPQQAAGG
jgi:predicted enzyme related to lactoylglutathione lyase